MLVRRDQEGRFDGPVVIESLDDLPPTDMALIDIPIGLPDRGRRDCDVAARAVLGPQRGRSVFTGARRPLLTIMNRESAHAWGKKQDDLGVSEQLWAILPKIREVDAWINSERNQALREGHPELSFFTGRREADGIQQKEGKGPERTFGRAYLLCRRPGDDRRMVGPGTGLRCGQG